MTSTSEKTLLSRIDRDYTAAVEAEKAGGGKVIHKVFTEDEVDALFDEAFDDDGSFVIGLAEEAIQRSTGLKADLSVQGAARKVVVRAGAAPDQEHNTFIANKTIATQRDLVSIKRDRDTIPKITPQDANIMVKSIDFPLSRTHATPLDGIKVSERDNPIERALLNQVTFCQILANWNVDISSISDAINQEWGIDYSRALISDLSLAKVSDLSAFLASGGRPPPAISMSANQVSMAKIVQSPTVNVDLLGINHAFEGRAKVQTQFLMLTTNILRGTDCVVVLKTHMNDKFMSKFHPDQLLSWHIPKFTVSRKARGISSVPGLASFDEFVECRQAAAIRIRNRNQIIREVTDRIDHKRISSLTKGIMRRMDAPREAIIADRGVSQVMMERVDRDSDPRKLSPILFDLYNGRANPILFASVMSTCGVITALCSLSQKDMNLALVWQDMCSTVGFGQVFKALNMESIQRNAYMREVTARVNTSDMRMGCCACLLARHINYIRPSVRAALETSLNITLGKARGLGMRNVSRPWKTFLAEISRTESHNPYKHVARLMHAAAVAGSDSSMLDIDNHVARHLSDPANATYKTAKPLAAAIRHHWSKFYKDMCKVWQNVGYIASKLCKTMDSPWLRPLFPELEDVFHSNHLCKYVRHMAYVEMVRCQAFSMAYMWSEVRVGGTVRGALAAKDNDVAMAMEMARYVDYLGFINAKELAADVDVEVKWNKQHENGLFRNKLRSGASFVLTAFYGKKSNSDHLIKRTIKEILGFSADAITAVRNTTFEAVNRDRSVLRNLDLPDKPEPMLDVDPDDFEWEALDNESFADAAHAVNENSAQIGKSIMDHLQLEDTVIHSKTVMGLMDVIVPAADAIYPVSSDTAELLDDIGNQLDDDLYAMLKEEVDSMVEDLKMAAMMEPEMVSVFLARGLQDKIHTLASTMLIERPRENIMS